MSVARNEREEQGPIQEGSTGIVVADGRASGRTSEVRPRIAAFIWGGKVRPAPTLAYGRWKGAA